MIRRLIILLLIVGCGTEPKDCAGVEGGTAQKDNCGICDGDGTITGDGYVLLWNNCYSIEETTFLNLNNNQLTGEIPSEIGNLTNLTALWLNNNQVTGEIPSEIGNLTNLTSLILYFNQLTGEIPPEIGYLTNLTYLGLWNNQLTGEIPQEVCDLIESNSLSIDNILDGNDLINTCE